MAFARPRGNSSSARGPGPWRRPAAGQVRSGSIDLPVSNPSTKEREEEEEEEDVLEAYSLYLQSELALCNVRNNAELARKKAEETVAKVCSLISVKMEEVSRLHSAQDKASHLRSYIECTRAKIEKIEAYLKHLEPQVDRLNRLTETLENKHAPLIIKGVRQLGDTSKLQLLRNELKIVVDEYNNMEENGQLKQMLSALNEYKESLDKYDCEWARLTEILDEVERLSLSKACQTIASNYEKDSKEDFVDVDKIIESFATNVEVTQGKEEGKAEDKEMEP